MKEETFNPTVHVEGVPEANEEPEIEPEKKEGEAPQEKKGNVKFKIPEELKKYLPQVKAFMDKYKMTLASTPNFARKFKIELPIKFEPATGFAFYLETGQIGLDVKFWEWKEKFKGAFNDEMLLFCNFHEIGHFFDLAEDPDGMQEGFDHMKKESQRLVPIAKKIFEKKLKPGQSLPSYLSDKAIEQMMYKRIHRLYNSLDDIYVNRRVGMVASSFSKNGSNAENLKRLYRDFLFPTGNEQGVAPQEMEAADYSNIGLDRQLTAYLLRSAMVPDQDILLVPEVKQALDRKVFKGESLKELVLNLITKPVSSMASQPRDATFRYDKIKTFVEPVWRELLLKDLENKPLPSEPKKGEGGEGGEPGDDDAPPFEDDPEMTDEDIKDFKKQKKQKDNKEKKEQKKKEQDSKKKVDEKLADKDLDKLRKLAKENGIEESVAQDYWEISQQIKPYKEKLAQIFEKFLRTVNDKIVEFWETGYKTGRLDVKKLIAKYSDYFTEGAGQFIPWNDLDVYLQKEFLQKVKLFPTEVRMRLISDGSGSMVADRRDYVKKIMVLLLEGMATFEDRVNRNFELKDKFKTDTEAWVFGSGHKKTKAFSGVNSGNAAIVERMKAFSGVDLPMGGTDDSTVWQEISESYTDPVYLEKLKKGKAKELIFEITDGEEALSSAQETNKCVNDITQLGAIIFGFQVALGKEKCASFNEAFGDKGSAVENFPEILPIIAAVLEKEIGSLNVELEYED